MQNTCFVIMGFGVKTDLHTGKKVDLDYVYNYLIKPAVTRAGLKCVRADEIKHSSLIDVPMYEHLLGADLVIADLSTSNPNAIYELGVRHAVKQFSTILIANDDFDYPFDVNHVAFFSYKNLSLHYKKELVEELIEKLKDIVIEVRQTKRVDSPFYSLLRVTPPKYDRIIEKENSDMDGRVSLKTRIDTGNRALENEDYATAEKEFAEAIKIEKNEFLVQKMCLSIYKNATIDELKRYKKS